MSVERRPFPQGVDPKQRINLREFLPYRIHRLSSRVAMPQPFTLPNGDVLRAREWRVLLQLAARGPRTNGELANLVGLDAATITRVVQQLSQMGLVRTKVSSTDRRKQFVSLTPAGAEAHDLVAPGRKVAAAALGAGLTAAELKTLFNLFDKLDAHLENRSVQDEADWDDD